MPIDIIIFETTHYGIGCYMVGDMKDSYIISILCVCVCVHVCVFEQQIFVYRYQQLDLLLCQYTQSFTRDIRDNKK